MKKLIVAQTNIEMNYSQPTLLKQAKPYEADFDKADIVIDIAAQLPKLKNENNHLSLDECEYIFTGSAFYNQLLSYNGMLLHSSAVCVDKTAYLFSADSGVGKSTHTQLWQKYFGIERAKIINDDKPALRLFDGKKGVTVFGTPWSGKTDKNINMSAPLGAIIFIERSADNYIEKITPKQAIPLIMAQTLRAADKTNALKQLSLLDAILACAPVYRLGCSISLAAVELCYNTVRRNA